MAAKVLRFLRGLVSLNPIDRIAALERLTEHFLWKLPRAQIDAHLEIPPPLPQSVLEGARLFENREAMLALIPKGGEVAEIGTWKGGFSRSICETVRPRVFHLIDFDFSQFDWAGIDCKFVKHEGDSSTILRAFPAASLDWAYIDGDHSYEGARKDLEAANGALKPGALMTCNDYTNWCSLAVAPYGVAKAVNEFVIRERYSVLGLAFYPAGNNDLLIRKPL